MFSAFESFIKGDVEVESAAAEEPEAEATETQAETSEAATGPDLMSSLWSGLSYVGESVQAGIAAQQEALDQAMVPHSAESPRSRPRSVRYTGLESSAQVRPGGWKLALGRMQ